MTGEEFRSLLRARPFRRFRVKTIDGDTVTMDNHEYALVSPAGSEVIIYDKDGHFHHIMMDRIITIEPVRQQPRKPRRK